jgi:sugar O-acyltransferase (sialic acid O-acetyltransferase NeuD family)
MYLYGASGHAKVIIDIIKSQGGEVIGLIDDNPLITELLGYPVYHSISNFSPIIISIGNNKTRMVIATRYSTACYESAVHSSAIISENCLIGKGTVIMQGAIVQSGSEIGNHCIINTGASVDHDCTVGGFVHVSPHATLCGNVIVGEGTWIGAGATIVPGICIGKWCIVGAGTVITKNIPDNAIIVGNPGRVIRYNDI